MLILRQQRYRAEQFRRAAAIYEELSQNNEHYRHEENDLRINSWATDAQLHWIGESQYVRHDRPSREDLESFETAYNAACFNIAKGALAQGEVLLSRAKSWYPQLISLQLSLTALYRHLPNIRGSYTRRKSSRAATYRSAVSLCFDQARKG